jgi:hypothetical protein
MPPTRFACVMSRRTMWIVVIGLCGVAAVFAVVKLADRSSDDDSSTTSASSAEAFADGTCTALTTWKGTVTQAVDNVKTERTKESVGTAADEARTATQTMIESIRSLGFPSTDGGTEAKATLQTLESQLRAGAATMQDAFKGASGLTGAVAAASTIRATLATMREQLATAGSSLRSLPEGELHDAFFSSSACSSLKNESA